MLATDKSSNGEPAPLMMMVRSLDIIGSKGTQSHRKAKKSPNENWVSTFYFGKEDILNINAEECVGLNR